MCAPTPSTERCSPSSSKSPSLRRWHRQRCCAESSRTFSLLSRLGLGERIIGKGDTADLTAPIDWAAVGERLGRERKLSLDYLRCAWRTGPIHRRRAPVKAEERPLPHLADHTHCTGCTACASGCPKDAITMERDREGFAYPVIDGAACVRCGTARRCAPSCGSGSELHARCIRGLE